MDVILDTNFLVLPFSKKVDIYELLLDSIDEPITLIVLEPCMEELERLDPAAAQLAKQKVKVVPAAGFADNAIVKYAEGKHALVCTQDYKLRQRLAHKKIPVAMYGEGRLRRR